MSEPKTQGIAYGSLYYDRGERLQKAVEQIVNVSKDKPVGWFFDVLCTKNQLPAVLEMLPKVVECIKHNNPDMGDDNIFVRYSAVKKHGHHVRPAQDLVLRLLKEQQNMEGKK